MTPASARIDTTIPSTDSGDQRRPGLDGAAGGARGTSGCSEVVDSVLKSGIRVERTAST